MLARVDHFDDHTLSSYVQNAVRNISTVLLVRDFGSGNISTSWNLS